MKPTRISQHLRLSLLLAVSIVELTGLCASPSPLSEQPKPLRIPVTVEAPARGFISLALYDKNDVLTRSLLHAEPVDRGVRTVEWDGTTDMGKPAATGAYTAKGVFFTEGPSTKFVMIAGKSGNPPWRTADGKGDWGGNLGFPSSIVSNGKSLVMGYAAVEDNQVTGVQQMDGNGNIQQRYFTFYPWDGRSAAAIDDTNYFLTIFNGDKKTIEIAAYKLGEPRGKILSLLPVKPWPEETETRWNGRLTAGLDGLTCTKDTLFATVANNDALFIVDRATGQVRNRVSLAAPHGIIVTGERLLVISGKKVLRLTMDGVTEAAVVDETALTYPHALATDAAGNIYVGDSGAGGPLGPKASLGTRQVLVFSPAGKLVRKIGKPGGTPQEGRFDENGLGIITALCVGPGANGKTETLWVNDIATGFPRTSRWSLDGKLENQWFGRKLSLFSDVLNPARPNELIYTSDAFADEPGISAYEMDLANKTWRPSWHYDLPWADMYQEDVFLSHEHGGNPLKGKRWPVFHYGSRNFVTFRDRNYFMNGSGNDCGPIFNYKDGEKPKPIALVFPHRAEKTAGGKIQGSYDQGPNNWFTWADRDGDGRMTIEEITFTENPAMLAKTSRLNEVRLDENLNVVMKRWFTENGNGRLIDSVLPLKELLPNGAPVYDWGQLRDLVPLQAPDLTGGDGTKNISSYQMPMPIETVDAFYSMVNPEPSQPLTLPGIDGQGWWASRNWRMKLARFDKQTGRPVWAVGRRAPGRAKPGEMYHPAALSGVSGGALFVIDTLGPMWVWTTNGLFLGHVFHDFGEGKQDDQALYGEIQATIVYTDPTSGKIYSIANDTGAHLHEIILPKLTPLPAGTVTLTAAQAVAAQPWNPDGPAPTDRPKYEAFHQKGVWAMKIDGDLSDREGWYGRPDGTRRPEALVLLDGQRLAGVQLMYDEKNLYLGYDVTAANGALNSGSELPYAPFVSGAYVDFALAPDWQGSRKDVRAGDVRVVLAQVKDGAGQKSFQQGFWQQKPNGANPRTITSPAASVKFDHIGEVQGLEMAYKIDDKDVKTGLTHYSVEIAIPLASLGLSDPAGKTIGFDASVGVANEAGDRRERAAHWAGLSEAFVVDRPGSTRLLPETWGTLTFVPAE